MVSSKGQQEVPGLGGFISATGVVPAKKSTIEYYPSINQPITQYETVQELLQRSEEATKEVGQKYIINTFDLGVCMKALPLVWKYPAKYQDHLILLGPFHTSMNYIGMITNHKCRGSGYAEILLEAQLVTSGCLKSVLSGKAYAKALFCLKVVCEALERLLLEVFTEEINVQISPEALLSLMKSCNRQHLDLALQDASTLNVIHQYIIYQERVRKGHLGKTAVYWMSVMDHQRLLFMMMYAVKTRNLKLFHVCNGKMAELFFAFDGPNYSRYAMASSSSSKLNIWFFIFHQQIISILLYIHLEVLNGVWGFPDELGTQSSWCHRVTWQWGYCCRKVTHSRLTLCCWQDDGRDIYEILKIIR